jgi:hypothetical protein
MEKNQKLTAKIKLKTIGINLLLFLILFGLVSLNKTYIRPNFTSPVMTLLSGSFPNFIAAFLISLFAVNAVTAVRPANGRLIVYASAVIISAILIIEEFKSVWGASSQFDRYDIIATIIGSLLAILTYEIILNRQKGQNRKRDN